VLSPVARGTRPPTAATNPVRKSTEAMRAVNASKPPPPPSGRVSQQLPIQTAVPSLAGAKLRRSGNDDDLAWDDDELETQIYDNPEDAPKTKPVNPASTSRGLGGLPLASPPTTPQPGAQAPSSFSGGGAAGGPQPAPPPTAPDLSSL